MGRESADPTMVSSSIALLQERFRQLQRVKERREEQQLLKMISQADHHRVCATRHFDQPAAARFSFQSDTIVPTRPSITPADHSLSLGLNLQTRQVDYFANSTATAAVTASASKSFDNSSDLDTSLHL